MIPFIKANVKTKKTSIPLYLHKNFTYYYKIIHFSLPKTNQLKNKRTDIKSIIFYIQFPPVILDKSDFTS